MANREKQRTVSRKHLARVERERIQTRNLKILSVVVFSAVLVLIAVGILDAYVLTPRRAVATVDNHTITAGDFAARVKYERFQLVSQFTSTYELMQNFGSDESTVSYFKSSLQQLASQLNKEIMGEQVLERMINEQILMEEAGRRGIEVSDDEVETYIAEQFFGYFANGTPTPEPTIVPAATSTLSPLQMTLTAPTPTPMVTVTEEITGSQGITGTQDITTTQDVTITEEITTPVEVEPTELPEPTPTAVPPTATPYTFSDYQDQYNSAMDNIRLNIGISEKDFRTIAGDLLLRQKVYDAIVADVSREQEQVWARHILVEDEETAQSIVERINAGEDFAALAIELSTDTGSGSQGGDLGWFSRGQMVAPFEELAFSLDIGEIDIVESEFGWHIIQVLGHETRQVDDSAFEQLQQNAYSNWLDAQREKTEIEYADDWITVTPEEPSIPQAYLDAITQ